MISRDLAGQLGLGRERHGDGVEHFAFIGSVLADFAVEEFFVHCTVPMSGAAKITGADVFIRVKQITNPLLCGEIFQVRCALFFLELDTGNHIEYSFGLFVQNRLHRLPFVCRGLSCQPLGMHRISEGKPAQRSGAALQLGQCTSLWQLNPQAIMAVVAMAARAMLREQPCALRFRIVLE